MTHQRYIGFSHRLIEQLTSEEMFIYHYGKFNCKYLKFKDANTVINIMDKYDKGCLDSEKKKFILENSNKEVLCSINRPNELHPDIFVFGDDDIPFQTDCFI